MTEIRLYIEGGGDANSKARLREAFSKLLGELKEEARRRRIGWRVVLCGSRNSTYEDFRHGRATHPNALNLLLVDAERKVTKAPCDHLSDPAGDAWLLDCADEHCHMMVETMEAWLVADPETLKAFYGQGFQASALPRGANVEQVSKQAVQSSLEKATRNSQKGVYHKTQHAPLILERLDPAKVRKRAPHCERLFATVEQLLSPEDA